MTALSSWVLYRPNIDMLPEILDVDDKINDEITDLEDVDLHCLTKLRIVGIVIVH